MIGFVRDKYFGPRTLNRFQIVYYPICLVGRHFLHTEVPRGQVEQFRQLWCIGGIAALLHAKCTGAQC